jgi:hypothetical protein
MCEQCTKEQEMYAAVRTFFCDYAEEHDIDSYGMLKVAGSLYQAVNDSIIKVTNEYEEREKDIKELAFDDKEEPFNQMIFRTDSRKERLN